MDGDLLLIFSFVTMMALIVFTFIRATHRRTIEHEERKLELLARTEGSANGSDTAGYRKLEERVRVLERIVTESRSDLTAQIEALRDVDMIEDHPAAKETAQ
jgi:hypothetical protein